MVMAHVASYAFYPALHEGSCELLYKVAHASGKPSKNSEAAI